MTATAHSDEDVAVMGVPVPEDKSAPGVTESAPRTGTRRALRRRDRRRRRVSALVQWTLLALVVVVLWPAQFGGFTGLTIVQGQSMQPTYSTGDLVVTVQMPTYQVGDIVSFTVPEGQPGAGGHVIHRIDTVTGDHYTTIGDNNTTADEWLITSEDITGRALVGLPGAGVILTPQVLPYLVALALGAIVTVLLWSPARRADEESAGGKAHDDEKRPAGAAR